MGLTDKLLSWQIQLSNISAEATIRQGTSDLQLFRMFIYKKKEKWAARRDEAWLASEERDTYLDLVRPLLLIMRALGRFPYSFTDKGVKEFKWFSIPMIYSLMFYCLEVYFTSLLIAELNGQCFTYIRVNNVIYWIGTSAFPILNYSVPITHWFDSTTMVIYINMWANFQRDFKYRLPRTEGVLRYPWIILSVAIVMVAIQAYLITGNEKPYLYFAYLTSGLSSASSSIVWLLSLQHLTAIANRLVWDIVKENFSQVEEHRRRWLRLSILTASIGGAFPLCFILYSVITFVFFFISTYGVLYILLFKMEKNLVFLGLILNVIHAFCYSAVLFDAAHRTTYAVGSGLLEKLLSQDFSGASRESKYQMSMFLQTVNTAMPEISLSGYVTVSRRLIVAFVMHTVTYLVVLLQFMDQNIYREALNHNTIIPEHD